MTTGNNDLLILFSQVDNWFEDIIHHEPISQFILEEEDLTKLAIITRTTGNWFRSLKEPQLSDVEFDDDDYIKPDDNIELHESIKNKMKCKSNKLSKQRKTTSRSVRNSISNIIEHETLDSLAKDLEFLLDANVEQSKDETVLLHKEQPEVEENKEPEFYYHNCYSDDAMALLDDTLGHCCTISNTKELKPSQVNHYQTIVVNHHYNSLNSSVQSLGKLGKINDLDIQTLLPQDHDYLAKPRPKPLVVSNKLMQSSRQNRQVKQSSVLITEAIKRFARFSDEFRILSKKTNENNK